MARPALALLPALACCTFPWLLGAQQPAPADAASTPTFSVDSRLVTVPVTVHDKKGALVQTLTAPDFTLTVDGTPTPIRYFDRDTNLPLTLGLLVDTSRSQRDVLDEERTSSAAFLDEVLSHPPQPATPAAQPASGTPAKSTPPAAADRVFVLQFARQAELLQDLTSSRPKLQAALQEIDTAPRDDRSTSNDPGSSGSDPNDPGNSGNSGSRSHARTGGTVLYDSLFLSADDVLKKEHGRKALIVLTDGVDNGSRESLTHALESVQRADVIVYAIYFKGSESQHNSGFPGGSGRGGRGGGWPGGGGGGWPGGGGGGWPGGNGGSRGGGNPSGQGHSEVDGKKILERLTAETGGRTFVVSKKETVADIYREIAEELRSQYRLGFSPSTAEGYHQIDLALPRDKSLQIQARDGYYTGSTDKNTTASN